MNKTIFLKPLMLMTLLLTSCGESPDKWSPDKALNRIHPAERRTYVTVNELQVQDSDFAIGSAIMKITYKNEKKNKSNSTNCFEYSFDVTGYMFPRNCTMTFYDDGYVDVNSPKKHFYYSFDKTEALALYTSVVSFVTINYALEE